MNKRLISVDCARALCMLWIIGFWNLKGYFVNPINCDDALSSNVTIGVLATFTFISASFLGRSKIDNSSDVIDFYKKRVIRIYPLFLLSAVSLYLIHLLVGINYIDSLKQLILTLLGLSSLLSYEPQTIWYIGMLISFYIFTPFVNRLVKPEKKIIFLTIGMIILVILNIFNIPSNNMLMYYPVYALGLVVAKKIDYSTKINIWLLLFSIIIFIICCLIKANLNLFIINYICMFALIYILICIGKIIAQSKYVSNLLTLVSYSSMVAYLFHRQFFGGLEFIFGKYQVWFSYLVALPALILISYWIQLLYDKLLKLNADKRTQKTVEEMGNNV